MTRSVSGVSGVEVSHEVKNADTCLKCQRVGA
jgi:hypothetical protein